MTILLTTQIAPPIPRAMPGTLTESEVTTAETVIADEIVFSGMVAVKWYVTVVIEDKVRFFEVAATVTTGKQPSYNIFADVGSRVKIQPDVYVMQDYSEQTNTYTNKIVLSIINNDAANIAVNVVRSIVIDN